MEGNQEEINEGSYKPEREITSPLDMSCKNTIQATSALRRMFFDRKHSLVYIAVQLSMMFMLVCMIFVGIPFFVSVALPGSGLDKYVEQKKSRKMFYTAFFLTYILPMVYTSIRLLLTVAKINEFYDKQLLIYQNELHFFTGLLANADLYFTEKGKKSENRNIIWLEQKPDQFYSKDLDQKIELNHDQKIFQTSSDNLRISYTISELKNRHRDDSEDGYDESKII